jgi:hypothetical protein
MRERCVIALGIAEGLDGRHLHMVGDAGSGLRRPVGREAPTLSPSNGRRTVKSR